MQKQKKKPRSHANDEDENVSPYHPDNHPLNLAFVLMLS